MGHGPRRRAGQGARSRLGLPATGPLRARRARDLRTPSPGRRPPRPRGRRGVVECRDHGGVRAGGRALRPPRLARPRRPTGHRDRQPRRRVHHGDRRGRHRSHRPRGRQRALRERALVRAAGCCACVVAEAPTAWIDALAEGCRSECGEVLGEFIAKMHHFDLLCDLPAMVRRQLVQPLDPSVRPDRVGTGGNGCEYDTALVLAALGSELAVVEEPLDEAGAQLDEHRPLTAPADPADPARGRCVPRAWHGRGARTAARRLGRSTPS